MVKQRTRGLTKKQILSLMGNLPFVQLEAERGYKCSFEFNKNTGELRIDARGPRGSYSRGVDQWELLMLPLDQVPLLLAKYKEDRMELPLTREALEWRLEKGM